MAKIGVQLIIFRDQVKELGVYEIMKRVKNIGYNCVEMSQIETSKENIDGLKKSCADFNMSVAAMSAAVEPSTPGQEALSTDFDKIVADCKTLRCNFLRVGILPFSYMDSLEKVLAFSKVCDEYAKKLETHGINLYYHNHHIEFMKYDGKYLLDIMKDSTKHLGFELDVHWIQRGGENPVEYMKGYNGRLELLHLKDFKVVEPDFTGLSSDDKEGRFAAFNNVVRFAEIGEGNLDFPTIIKTGIDCGAKYMFVEQDDTYGVDPFESLALSQKNLVKMGFSDIM